MAGREVTVGDSVARTLQVAMSSAIGRDIGREALALIDGGAHAILARECLPPACLKVEGSPTELVDISASLGSALAYADEFGGAFVHHIRAVDGHQDLQVSSGTCQLLPHIEDSYHALPPDFLVLGCAASGDQPVPTTLTVIDHEVVGSLPLRVQQILSERRFRFAYCYLTSLRSEFSPAFPVLERRDGGIYRVRYCELGATLCDSPEAKEVLETLRAAMPPPTDIGLSPGDVLVLDNRVVVHSRRAYEPTFDRSDRWLRRSYALTKESVDQSVTTDVQMSPQGVCAIPIAERVELVIVDFPVSEMLPGEFVVVPRAFSSVLLLDKRIGAHASVHGH